MAHGLPHFTHVDEPVPMPCAGHAGLGFREARASDAPQILQHFRGLAPFDRRMRFMATLTDEALERQVADMWGRNSLLLAAFDRPLRAGPPGSGPVRGLAELALGQGEAELAISVEGELRRQGIGTRLLQTAGRLVERRGITRIHAWTLPDNRSFLALARKAGGRIEAGVGEVEVSFDVAGLSGAGLPLRAAPAAWLRPCA